MSSPSFEHEGYVRLFKDRPELPAELLRDVFGVDLGAYAEARAEPGEVTDLEPAKRHADLVTQFIVDRKPMRAVVVEVQLDRADEKSQDILTVLETRGVLVDSEQRERIRACTDLDTLQRWLRKAATAASTDELFAE
jgi:hypothetical protein